MTALAAAAGQGENGAPRRYTVVVGVSSTSRSLAALRQEEQAQLEADVADVLGPDAGGHCRLVHGGPRKTLLAISRFVDLLVIDAPRRTDFHQTPLFARRLVHSAGCPVVIMPPGRRRADGYRGGHGRQEAWLEPAGCRRDRRPTGCAPSGHHGVRRQVTAG